MNRSLTPRFALRSLACGSLDARATMREALARDLGETERLGLVAGTALGIALADLAPDGVPASIAAAIRDATMPSDRLGHAAFWLAAAIALMLCIYLGVSGLVWLATRPAETAPSFAVIRTALAVGSWIALVPTILLDLVFYAFDFETFGSLVTISLSAAFVGMCLSEASELSSSAGMGIVIGSFVLTGIGLAVLLAGVPPLLPADASSVIAPGSAP